MEKRSTFKSDRQFIIPLGGICLALFFTSAQFFLVGCKNTATPTPAVPDGSTFIEATPQRSGDATKGYTYLVGGDYLSAGIPLGIFKLAFSSSTDDLGRSGDAQGIPYNYNAVTAFNGDKVVAPNCLSCHADRLNGKIYVGLGNTTTDLTVDQTSTLKTTDALVAQIYGKSSKEWEAYYPFSRGFSSIAALIPTATQGVNPADKIFGALSVFRNSADLKWSSDGKPSFGIPTEVIPTDVPAWWLMKKKHALYYNGLGVGDFGRLSMASALETMNDTTEARKIDNNFADVMSYLRTINPPAYPFAIDKSLADAGKVIFINTCAQCHGTYDAGNNTYPNLLVAQTTVNTDPALANVYAEYPQYHTWYNNSWFSKGDAKGQLLPTKGYVAPPLDGVWATAPYLHNGSVPTLDDLLNATTRPKFWERTFDNTDYNTTKLGWNYTVKTKKESTKTYDTTLKGYGNTGHYYGDKLSDTERKQLLEYLKTL